MSATLDLSSLDGDVLDFLTEHRLASITTIRPNGAPHVVPVGFTYDPDQRVARIITRGHSHKVRNILAAGNGSAPAAVCQVDGASWLTLSGTATVTDDPERVADAVARYEARYRPARPAENRVAIEIAVTSIMGRTRPRD